MLLVRIQSYAIKTHTAKIFQMDMTFNHTNQNDVS